MNLSVHSDESTFDLMAWDREELRRVAAAGGVLYWSYCGWRSKVPNFILQGALDAYDRYCGLKPYERQRYYGDRKPWLIYWEQTVTPLAPPELSTARPLSRRQEPPPHSEAIEPGGI